MIPKNLDAAIINLKDAILKLGLSITKGIPKDICEDWNALPPAFNALVRQLQKEDAQCHIKSTK